MWLKCGDRDSKDEAFQPGCISSRAVRTLDSARKGPVTECGVEKLHGLSPSIKH